VERALKSLQAAGIPAIPQTDALLCREQDREEVCRVLGREVWGITGVCPLVGGIRFVPEARTT
jgi:hypothetical protein